MVKVNLLGLEVDKEVYEAYANKLYTIPGKGVMTLNAVELYASSEKLADKYPDIAAACRNTVEEIRSEITGEAPQEPARAGFTQYIDKLHALYQSAAPARAALRENMDKIEAKWKTMVNTPNQNEKDLLSAKADFLAAQEEYKAEIDVLYASTQASIDEIREQLSGDLKDFYAPSGDRIDESVQKLLTSGVVLRESEVADLFEKNLSNVTMLRLLCDYCNDHKIDFPRVRVLSSLALSDGRNEMDIFDRVAGPVLLAVGHSETSVKVWSPENGLFDKYVTAAKSELENFYVKP